MDKRYAVMVVTRNGASTLNPTLSSLLGQATKPIRVCVVNDGSTDDTAEILAQYQSQNRNVFCTLNQPDRGYDIRRVPANLNLALEKLKAMKEECEYYMISGDDCVYPTEYAGSIISRMTSTPSVVVASGRPKTDGSISEEHSPSGSGRMIKSSFWNAIGRRYPLRAGWETWLLYKALESRFRIELYRDLVYEHLRPRGSAHRFTYWGAAMHSLGYHPLYALGRVAKNLIEQKITLKGSVNMCGGYLQACLGSSDPFMSAFEQPLRDFVHKQQGREIASAVRSLCMILVKRQ
jgi:glycosyltransferase involved in cell wall biosynthesis